MIKRFFSAVLCSCAVLVALPAQANEGKAPDALVQEVTNDVLEIVRKDQAIQSGDTGRAVDLVRDKVLPHFDFRHMTVLAVGRDWRQATKEQQASLVEAFKMLLVRTYSNALTQYKSQTIDFKPLRADAGATDVTVKTEVRQPGAQPVTIDYALEKQDSGWKVYDVVVAGVSLVTNYRGTFAQEVRNGGIANLLASLEAKNRELEAPGSK